MRVDLAQAGADISDLHCGISQGQPDVRIDLLFALIDKLYALGAVYYHSPLIDLKKPVQPVLQAGSVLDKEVGLGEVRHLVGVGSNVCGSAAGGTITVTVTLSPPTALTNSPRGAMVAATLILPEASSEAFARPNAVESLLERLDEESDGTGPSWERQPESRIAASRRAGSENLLMARIMTTPFYLLTVPVNANAGNKAVDPDRAHGRKASARSETTG